MADRANYLFWPRPLLLACLPGLAAQTWVWGPGNLLNVLFCCLFCSLAYYGLQSFSASGLGQPSRHWSGGGLLTGLILGLALPPYCEIWLLLSGCILALALGHGWFAGRSPFNPAMCAYALLLVATPQAMHEWPKPTQLLAPDQEFPGLSEHLLRMFDRSRFDALSGATLLDQLKHNQGQTWADQLRTNAYLLQATWAAAGVEWINLGFLLGGLWLVQQRVIPWQTPLGVLLGIGALAAWGFDSGSSAGHGSPLAHWFSGATMLGAFFIATEPASGAQSSRAQLAFGLGVGALTYSIRAWGQYPDGLAFAVLLMNFIAPSLDRLFHRATP